MLLPLLLLLTLAHHPYALAAPQLTRHEGPIHVPIVRRSITEQERVAKLPYIMDAIRLKYGFRPTNHKRSTTSSSITDEGNDSTYSTIVSIGTPAQEFNLILDTGSSDLWVATNECSTCTPGTPFFDPPKSTSFKNGSTGLQINYGSGSAEGYVAQDTVAFSGFTISDQTLLAATGTSAGMLNESLSGIMGLGFQPLSSLQATPFWETLYSQSKLSSPVFSFYLERYVNDPNQIDAAPGGIFTFGGTNTSLYQGSIDFISMPNGTVPSFWFQQIKTVTVQGKKITISSSEGLAAIDTGTSLIGAPSSITQEIWSNVPDSVALSGEYAGMYAFPCTTSVSVSFSFGGNTWAISTADMNLGAVGESTVGLMCAGGIFDIGSSIGSSGQNVPSWIVGDTFLKNVYSVFQANPPAVGFAQLASSLSSSDGTGSGQATYSGSIPLPSGLGNNGTSSRMSLSMSLGVVASLLAVLLITF